MSVFARVARNTSWTLASNVWNKANAALFFIVVSRLLGPQELGRFSLVQTFFFYFYFLSNFGISQTVVREIARDKSRQEEIFFNAFTLRFILATVSSALLAIFVFVAPYPEDIRLYMAIMGVSIFTTVISDGAQNLFVAHERLKVPAVMGMFYTSLSSLGGLACIVAGYGLREVFMVTAVAHVWVAGANMWLVRREYQAHRFQLDSVVARALLRETLPLGLLIIMTIIHGKIDLVMLSKIPGGADLAGGPVDELVAVGCYSVSYKLFETSAIALLALRKALMPTISTAMSEGPKRVHAAYLRFCGVLTLLYGLPLVLFTPFGAKWIVTLVFGADFVLATVPVMILAFAYALYAYNALMIPILINSKRLLSFTGFGFLMIGINIALNALFIPRWSLNGAAAATLISTVIMTGFKFRVIGQEFGASAVFRLSRRAGWVALLGLLAASSIHFTLGWAPLAVTVGLTTYFAFLMGLRVLPLEDRRIFGRVGARLARLKG